MNVWNFTGNLGGDAETRFTPNGDAVVSFSVGVKAGFGDKATTTWARCSMFGKRGQAVADYLVKGQLVGISGEVNLREYDDKSGNKRSSLDVRVNDLTLLGRRDDAGGRRTERPAQQAAPQSRPAQQGGFDSMDDDIPF